MRSWAHGYISAQLILHWIFGSHFLEVGAILCIGIGVAMALSTDLLRMFQGSMVLWNSSNIGCWKSGALACYG